MSKRIFCDLCGEQMSYGDIDGHLRGEPTVVDAVGHEKRPLRFTVSVTIDSHKNNGEHIDLCGDCRYYVLDKLDNRPKAA
jgi:hypothetical protein